MPFAQWSDARWDSSQSSGGGIPSVLALIGAYDIALRCTLGTARKPLFEAKVFDVCAKDGLLLPISLSPQQPFPSSPLFDWRVSPGANHAKEKKCWTGRRIVPLGLQSHSAVRQCTGSRVCRDTDPPRRGIQRGRQTVPTEIPVTGDYLSAQAVRRGLSQSAKPARESPVPIRLASLAWNCGDRVHDPPGSRAPCFSSVQGVRTAQSR